MTESNKWLLLAGLTLGGWLVYLLSPVLAPFMVGALLAYMGDPLVDRLEALHISRTLSVLIVFVVLSLVVLLLMLVFVPLLERQFTVLAAKVPAIVDWLQGHALPWLREHFGLHGLKFDLGSVKSSVREHWQAAGGVAATLLSSVSRSGLLLVGWVANLVLIPVVTFYLLRDWDILVAHVRGLLPRAIEPTVSELVRQSDEVLGAFLRGQLLVMLALAVVYATGLWVVGLDVALLIGFIAGMVSFVPYLGFIIGILAASIAALLQFHDLSHLLYVLLAFGVGQVLESTVLTPLLVGDRIGLHPVAVIFAVLAGGQLFGFFGVLLALPVAAVIMVLVRYAYRRYKGSSLYGAPVSSGSSGELAAPDGRARDDD